MSVDLRIAENDWAQLRRHCAASFRGQGSAETGALAVLGERTTSTRHEFVVAELLLPEPGDLKMASCGEVVFDASFVRRAHLAMRKAGLAGVATFHTHPFADRSVSFSGYDDRQDPLLATNLVELEPRTKLISVVAGKQSQCGRYFPTPGHAEPLGELIVVGERLNYLGLRGEAPAPAPRPAAIFDRGLPLTDPGALNRLAQMTIAVVGASGTGSLVCELLARAGCKRVLLIDHDIVRVINLNRMLYATADDARRGLPKVNVLKRGIEALGLGCRLEAVHGSILDDDILRRVLDADLVVGCVDRALPRHLLCQLSYRYLMPYIDVGTEIGGDEDGIVSLNSRVSYVSPGRYCLTCAGVVSSRRLRYESLTEAERQREVALGYSDDLLIQQPAVMDLNMRSAGGGVLLLRHLLQPFLREPFPVTLAENAVTYRTIPVSVAREADPRCRTCQANARYGFGDCGPHIGYDAATARRLAGTDVGADEAPTDVWHWLRTPYFLRRAYSALTGGNLIGR